MHQLLLDKVEVPIVFSLQPTSIYFHKCQGFS
jgi:hypothetical protein